MITFLRSQTNFINHRLTITKSAQYIISTLERFGMFSIWSHKPLNENINCYYCNVIKKNWCFSWFFRSNAHLVESLKRQGVIRDDRVAAVMKSVDRGDFCDIEVFKEDNSYFVCIYKSFTQHGVLIG